jgi:hypothetical protein
VVKAKKIDIKDILTVFLLIFLSFWLGIEMLIVGMLCPNVVDAQDITSYSDTSTSITLSVRGGETPVTPGVGLRINWYDLQTTTGISRLNERIDVNQEYIFCINVSSDWGWDVIEYIRFTAWYDNGNESTTYNDTGNHGGNLNLYLQYENTTGVPHYAMLWPDEEVIKGDFTETASIDPHGIPGSTECHTLTLSFRPGSQFRYAPGDGDWEDTSNVFNDRWSWNFKIQVVYRKGGSSSLTTAWVQNEFGVNGFAEIASTGVLAVRGLPGENVTSPDVTVVTRSNLGYSLSVNIDSFLHEMHPVANISNETMWVRGGDIIEYTHLGGEEPLYLMGSSSSYVHPDDNNSSKIIDSVKYRCDIPYGQLPGNYRAHVHYKLRTTPPITL